MRINVTKTTKRDDRERTPSRPRRPVTKFESEEHGLKTAPFFGVARPFRADLCPIFLRVSRSSFVFKLSYSSLFRNGVVRVQHTRQLNAHWSRTGWSFVRKLNKTVVGAKAMLVSYALLHLQSRPEIRNARYFLKS